MMRSFGNPQDRYPVLHIAGTNGKGSVAAMTESILRHSGLRTGLYTSPHLIRIEERIRVAGTEIAGPELGDLAARVEQRERVLLDEGRLLRPLTYFEIVTACGFLHFADSNVDVAVVEVGLGGLHDATNIVRPAACAITSISYDHQHLLGNTLTQIATEKAGIIKPGVPVFTGRQTAETKEVLVRKAQEVHAPILDVTKTFRARVLANEGGRYTFDLQTPSGRYSGLALSLRGAHQVRNATLAIALAQSLAPARVLPDAVRTGLACTRWPGRLDYYQARRRTLLDGGHNEDGARLLRDYLRQQKEISIHLVFGAVRDKDLAGMGRSLFPGAASIHLTRLSNERSADPAAVAALFPRLKKRVRIHENAVDALEAAWAECPPDGLVVVTGSLYLVGELLPYVAASRPPDGACFQGSQFTGPVRR